MEKVFRGLHWKTLLLYLDDVIVIGTAIPDKRQVPRTHCVGEGGFYCFIQDTVGSCMAYSILSGGSAVILRTCELL